MNRRKFLKLAAASSALSLNPTLNLYAANNSYDGPLWLTIQAAGGWDPTSFCDPKGYINSDDADRINNYPASKIQQIENFSVAPPPDSFLNDSELYTAKQFFESHFKKLLVINGIDMQAIGHKDAQRHAFTGKLGNNGYPHFGALVASEMAGNYALPYITSGGFSSGGGLLTPVTVNRNWLNALSEITYPNRSQNADSLSSRLYFPEDIVDMIEKSSANRLNNIYDKQKLPRIKAAIKKLQAARGSTGTMGQLSENLISNEEFPSSFFNGRNNARDLYRQGHVALAAYESGVTAAANISLSGFDTHGNHDASHYPRLMDFLQGIDAIVQEAKTRGLDDRLVIMVASDFGRTNKYNDGNGKDHWPISSMMFMGNNEQFIQGNRVIGQTTNEQKIIKIDPSTLAPDINDNNVSSTRITPAHIHRSLRKLAGIESANSAFQFELPGEDIDLFG